MYAKHTWGLEVRHQRLPCRRDTSYSRHERKLEGLGVGLRPAASFQSLLGISENPSVLRGSESGVRRRGWGDGLRMRQTDWP